MALADTTPPVRRLPRRIREFYGGSISRTSSIDSMEALVATQLLFEDSRVVVSNWPTVSEDSPAVSEVEADIFVYLKYFSDMRSRMIRAFVTFLITTILFLGSMISIVEYARGGAAWLHPWVALLWAIAALFLAIVAFTSIWSMNAFVRRSTIGK